VAAMFVLLIYILGWRLTHLYVRLTSLSVIMQSCSCFPRVSKTST
jgi:hypothetical protein